MIRCRATERGMHAAQGICGEIFVAPGRKDRAAARSALESDRCALDGAALGSYKLFSNNKLGLK